MRPSAERRVVRARLFNWTGVEDAGGMANDNPNPRR